MGKGFSRFPGRLGAVFLAALAAVCLWIWWSEAVPAEERKFRLGMRSLLESRFPQAMQAPAGVYGLFHLPGAEEAIRQTVVLIHGLDEPGGIWDALIPALSGKPVALWELRYPNDQAIDFSADFLAEQWRALPANIPVVLIAHSMGGLVARDFVSRHRHPVDSGASVGGAQVEAVFLVGTPNHGSEWARLRIWLELRDFFESQATRDFSLFSALQDGLGTAKVDLRPGSDFLNTLNARQWPGDVDVRLIGGRLLDATRYDSGIEWLRERTPGASSKEAIEAWWNGTRQDLGDGVVTLESLELEGLAAPVVFPASHRGLLRRTVLDEGTPPAVPLLGEWLDELIGQ